MFRNFKVLEQVSDSPNVPHRENYPIFDITYFIFLIIIIQLYFHLTSEFDLELQSMSGHPNAGNSGTTNGPNQDQMGQLNFPVGGNDEWRTETYRNKGIVG